MNLSLKKRISISFIVASGAVLVMIFMVYFYFDSLNAEIAKISEDSKRVSHSSEQIGRDTLSLLRFQNLVLERKTEEKDVLSVLAKSESIDSQLDHLGNTFKDTEIKQVISKMISYVDGLKIFLENSKGKAAELYDRKSELHKRIDRVMTTFYEFRTLENKKTGERDKKIDGIVSENKRKMMITLIIGFFANIILGLVVPGKIALPFKKIRDAIRELQECNFDVSIYYNQDDEIGEIAREMNRMIHSFKVFDELRTDRVNVEHRKFEVLANMMKKNVLVANADNALIYLNNQFYSLLQLQSEDVIGKKMTESVIPKSIIEAFEKAIKRRSKIENVEVVIPKRKGPEEEERSQVAEKTDDAAVNLEEGEEGETPVAEEEAIFRGYANVIPIRGKESSLDYYLMILSEEIAT